MNPNYGLMVELRPEFQKTLFTLLLKKYGRIQLSEAFGKASSQIYHYRNLRIKGIPLETLNTSLKLVNISHEHFQSNIIRTYSAAVERGKILHKGREIRTQTLRKIRNEIPPLASLYDGRTLQVEPWFLAYKGLIDFGARNFQPLTWDEEKIELCYTCYSEGKKKAFMNYLPKKIKVDEEFQYFFGLWCGDRLGRGRMGVANKDKAINMFTKDYLLKLHQRAIEFTLIYQSGIARPQIDYVDRVICSKGKTKINGYCISVGTKNSILFQFFDYLKTNLDEFLSSFPSKNFFFAGLFDAEGNIFLEDACFRWACLERKMLKVLLKHFQEEGIYKRYDGCNIISYNLSYFKDKIYPYLKHTQKRNKAELLFFGKGVLEKRFTELLGFLEENSRTPRELAKHLKRVKVYGQLRFLEKSGYIQKKDYPMKVSITKKGLEQIRRGEGS